MPKQSFPLQTQTPKMSTTFSLVGLLAFALTFPLTLSACKTQAETKAPPPPPVTIQVLNNSTVADSSDFVATLISRQSVSLQSQVPGQIKTLYVKAGDHVRQGQMLMLLDPARQQATVGSNAAAALSQKSQVSQTQEALHGLQEQRKGLESALALSQQQVTRYSTLYSQQSASLQDLQTAQDTYNRAKASLDANSAQISAQKAAIIAAQSQYRQATALTRQEQVQLQYYRITAPFAGVVGDIPVKLGNYVQPQTPLLSVTDNDPLEVNLSIPAERLNELKMGLPIEILNENHDLVGTAPISFIAPNMDENAQTILVKAILKNPDGKFKAAQVVNARIIWKRLPGLRIPTQSVVHMGGRDFVFVVNNETGKDSQKQAIAHQKPVTVGRIEGPNYVLESGLKAGEQLVTSGIQKLTDSTPVSVR